jgi:3-hydroxyisobutyryl-CoA hydrolase
VSASQVEDVLLQITQLDNPTLPQLSSIISSFNPAPPADKLVSSKANRDGHSRITGEIRLFLDQVFGQDSLQAIHKSLTDAVDDPKLSKNVKSWAAEQKEHMDLRSPTGMAVALEGWKRARLSHRLDATLLNGMFPIRFRVAEYY